MTEFFAGIGGFLAIIAALLLWPRKERSVGERIWNARQRRRRNRL